MLPNLVYGAIAVVFVTVLALKGPIPQDPAYHDFADQRTMLGIPHFWNVVSNVPMFFIGLAALIRFSKWLSNRPDFASKWIPIVLAFGVFITSFGSAYYHYAPDNQTLVWDRAPMTLMFMPVFSLLIYDFINPRWGFWAFLISVPLGLFSIACWQHTESIGQGDLRFYAFVQFFPMLIGPAILLLSSKKTGYTRYFWLVLGWYLIAKFFEHFDHETFQLLGFWSGHTIKHLIGAISLYYLVKLVSAWDTTFLPEHRYQ